MFCKLFSSKKNQDEGKQTKKFQLFGRQKSSAPRYSRVPVVLPEALFMSLPPCLQEFDSTISKEVLSEFLCWFLYHNYVQPREYWPEGPQRIDQHVLARWIALGTKLQASQTTFLPRTLSHTCTRLQLNAQRVREILIRLSQPGQMSLSECSELRQTAGVNPLKLLTKINEDVAMLRRLVLAQDSPHREVISAIDDRMDQFLDLIIYPQLPGSSPASDTTSTYTEEEIDQALLNWVDNCLPRVLAPGPYCLAAHFLGSAVGPSIADPLAVPAQTAAQNATLLLDHQSQILLQRVDQMQLLITRDLLHQGEESTAGGPYEYEEYDDDGYVMVSRSATPLPTPSSPTWIIDDLADDEVSPHTKTGLLRRLRSLSSVSTLSLNETSGSSSSSGSGSGSRAKVPDRVVPQLPALPSSSTSTGTNLHGRLEGGVVLAEGSRRDGEVRQSRPQIVNASQSRAAAASPRTARVESWLWEQADDAAAANGASEGLGISVEASGSVYSRWTM